MNMMQEASYRPRAPLWLACALAFACVLLYVLLLTGCGPSPAEPRPDPQPPVDADPQRTLEQAALRDINYLRLAATPKPAPYLQLDDRLSAVAQAQVRYMAQQDRLTHDRPPGVTLLQQLRQQGYDAVAWGENVAYTTGPDATAWQDAIGMWGDSPGHYANMVDPRFTELGVAVVRGPRGRRIYFCLVLAKRGQYKTSLPEPLRDIDSEETSSEQ